MDGTIVALHSTESNKLSTIDAESLREGMVLDCAKVVSDLLLSLNGLKGSLSIPILVSSSNDSSIMADADCTAGKHKNTFETLHSYVVS